MCSMRKLPLLEACVLFVSRQLHAQAGCPLWNRSLLKFPAACGGHAPWWTCFQLLEIAGWNGLKHSVASATRLGSLLLRNSCANMVKTCRKYRATSAALEQAVRERRPMRENDVRKACINFIPVRFGRVWIVRTGPWSGTRIRIRKNVCKEIERVPHLIPLNSIVVLCYKAAFLRPLFSEAPWQEGY